MNSKSISTITLLILAVFSACNPATLPAAPVAALPVPTEISITPTTLVTEPAISTPEEGQFFREYLPLATRPDVSPQTIDGVTAQIDWVYVDESRVALHYTISGLDWPDGTTWDTMSVQVTSPTVSNIGYGGGGWSSTLADQGVITGSSDQLLVDSALKAEEQPAIDLIVEIPIEDATFHFELNVPVRDGIRIENIGQTVAANEVAMTLDTLVLNPSRAEALICFEMPSAVDWGLTASTINVGGTEYRFSGGGLMPGTAGKKFSLTDPVRCSTVGFDIAYHESARSVTLTVPALLASIPEVIDKERVATANQRLAGTGLEFDYLNVDHGGKIEILKRPEGMTDEEAYPLIREALTDRYPGPWIFTVAIER